MYKKNRLICGSKSLYHKTYPENLVLFNGGIFIKSDKGEWERVWRGDLDVTKEIEDLKEYAKELDTELWLFHEADGGFWMMKQPNVGNVAVVVTDKTWKLGETWRKYYDSKTLKAITK